MITSHKDYTELSPKGKRAYITFLTTDTPACNFDINHDTTHDTYKVIAKPYIYSNGVETYYTKSMMNELLRIQDCPNHDAACTYVRDMLIKSHYLDLVAADIIPKCDTFEKITTFISQWDSTTYTA